MQSMARPAAHHPKSWSKARICPFTAQVINHHSGACILAFFWMSPRQDPCVARIAAPCTNWRPAPCCTGTATESAFVPTRFATAEAAEIAFYDALEKADLAKLMQVWADDEEIICVHPGGLRLIGHHAVKESWQEILSNGGLPIRHTRSVALNSMMSVTHSLIEAITVQGPNGPEQALCFATNVYHKGPTGWRLVMHHASAAPAEAGMLDLHDIPGLLH